MSKKKKYQNFNQKTYLFTNGILEKILHDNFEKIKAGTFCQDDISLISGYYGGILAAIEMGFYDLDDEYEELEALGYDDKVGEIIGKLAKAMANLDFLMNHMTPDDYLKTFDFGRPVDFAREMMVTGRSPRRFVADAFGLSDFTVKDWRIETAPDDYHLIEFKLNVDHAEAWEELIACEFEDFIYEVRW